jgi:fibronectin-binding autotransporter adhesin
MTISFGSRFTSLPKWSASTDAFSREQFTNAFTQIDASAAGWSSSVLDSTGTIGGFFHYNTNLDQLKVRVGGAWVLVSDGNEMRSSTIDAKGDLLAGTGDNVVARIAVGADGRVLSADAAQASGMAWNTTVSSLLGTANEVEVSAASGAVTVGLPSAVTIGTLTIDSVAISTVQTGSESFVDNDTSLMTSAAINDRIATLDSNTTYTSSDFTHDNLTGFVANEHIDWSATNGANIHATNYTNNTYTADGTSISLTSGVFSHADTSDEPNSSNSDQRFIQSITLDAYGHIQTISAADTTDTNTTYDAETDGGLSLSGSNEFSIASGPTISGGLTVAGKLEVSNSNLEFGLATAFITTTNGENAIKIVQDQGVTLYHDGTGTFTTTSEGATVLGNATVTGGLTVDATTLHVDIANNRVGIGTTTPGYSLDVTDTLGVTGAATLSSTLGVTGAATLSSTLTVASTFAVTGAALMYGTLTAAGATTLSSATLTDDLVVDTDTLFVDASTDRVGINDSSPSYSLDVSGTARVTGLLHANAEIHATANVASTPVYTFAQYDTVGMWASSFLSQDYVVLAAGDKYLQIWDSGIVLMTDPGVGSGSEVRWTGDALYRASSQQVLKENIATIATSDALTRIKALRPVEYNMKSELFSGDQAEWQVFHKERGFIAEEVATVDHWMAHHWWLDPDDPKKQRPSPNSGTDDGDYEMDGTSPVDWDKNAMIADLVAVVQSLESRVVVLEA